MDSEDWPGLRLAGYQRRPQQEEMAAAVAEALERGRALVVEAGTGVGKSLAYLLPTARWAVSGERRVLVSTYTRALQQQLLDKELPAVARALGERGLRLRYAMLQGADNYLCVQRLEAARRSPGLFDGNVALLERLSAWAAAAQSGHRSGLPCVVPRPLWQRVSRDPDRCLGPGGPFWGRCLYRKDRERAERSHIVVVNHALLLSGARLPPHDALIIDEAHSLEEAAASRFETSVGSARLRRLLSEAEAAGGAQLGELGRRALRGLEELLARVARAHGWEGGGESGGAALAQASRGLGEPEALGQLEGALLKLSQERSEARGGAEEVLSLALAATRLSELRAELRRILEGREEEVARWVEWSGEGVSVHALPLELGRRLGAGILAGGAPLVLTSATLDCGGGLKAFSRRLGLEAARQLKLDSPFDYAEQAGLLLQDDLPSPSEKRYDAALARRCKEIAKRVPGGVFVLFSSWKTLRAVHARLRRAFKDRPLWIQGDSGNDALLAEFTRAGNAVLLGVDTFWQGVDVPGAALSCVVLTKLPFPNFSSPVEQERRRWLEGEGRSYFADHSLPRAVMRFRQGFGRLIRSAGDRGVVAVLDGRLSKRGYGAAFLEALPRCRRLEGLDELAAFFCAAEPSGPADVGPQGP
ncbi:MAG: ATP-dependent DNA helicase [Elusimicrobia bacterium]|nr:ATP-dependent DNA helicase [Elusimicrobiota bacterium]MDE2424486.1 ATP-dependent DNA helicase [Elusimicrobiota bacterium]